MSVDFDLPVGTPIQFELLSNHQQQKAHVHLIGYEHGKSILVSTPRVEGDVLSLLLNDEVALRYLHGNAAQAFESAVYRICSDPFPYIHLLFPTSIESIKVRNAERIRIQIDGQAQQGKEGTVIPVRLMDLSIGGASISSPHDLGDINDKFSLSFDLTFAGLKEKMNIPVVIRSSTRKTHDEYLFGLAFDELDEHHRMFLQGCLYEVMSQRR